MKMSIQYNRIQSIKDPLLFMKPLKNHRIKNDGVVKIKTKHGIRTGQVLTVNEKVVTIQIVEGASGITMKDTSCVFLDDVFKFGVSREMLGRRFNGLGEVIDGKSLLPEKMVAINGTPIKGVHKVVITVVITLELGKPHKLLIEKRSSR